jgi:hypothetical protein
MSVFQAFIPEGITDQNCYTSVYPKVSGLAAWSENCKWYSSLPLGAVFYRYFMSQSSEFCHHNPLCFFSTSVYCCFCLFRCRLSPETFGYSLVSRCESPVLRIRGSKLHMKRVRALMYLLLRGKRDASQCIHYEHVKRVPCHHGMARPRVADGRKASRYEG